MNINHDALVVAGYEKLPTSSTKVECNGLYVKTIYSDNGEKLYFIHTYLWKHSAELEVYFYLPEPLSFNDTKKATSVQIKIPVCNPSTTIADMESLLARMYANLNAVPDMDT